MPAYHHNILEGIDVKRESHYIDCPKCNGVKKFSISNQDGLLLYNCYRAFAMSKVHT